MSLHVTTSGDIIVRAPLSYSDNVIHKFVEKNAAWIDAQMARVVRTRKQYQAGEKFWYLGVEHELVFEDVPVIEARNGKLYFPRFLKFRVQKELALWFQSQAKNIITEQLKRTAALMETTYLHVTFSETKSRWGSCSPENALQFNWKLIMCPPAVMNYVIVHELAHTREKNHGTKFWQIIRFHSPAYRAHRNWLKKFGDQLVL